MKYKAVNGPVKIVYLFSYWHIMKKSLLLALLTGSFYFGSAQHDGHQHETVQQTVTPGAATKAPVPETLTLREEVYDFGKIPQGKPVTHVFEVINSGNSPLKINTVQASCGCTTPQWENDKDIPAKGSSQITVGYNAAAEGPFTKFITITYNDTQTKQMTIKGEVWKTPAASAPENQGVNELKD